MGEFNARILFALSNANRAPAPHILIVEPPADYPIASVMTELGAQKASFISAMAPVYDAFLARGYEGYKTLENLETPPEAALLVLPRSKDLAQNLLAQICDKMPNGLVIVDGHKTDGIESILKDLRKKSVEIQVFSKSHGKVLLFNAVPLDDWKHGAFLDVDEGFVTTAGVFSADGPDPGSVALARALPQNLGPEVLDLGGGWGYLSRKVLQNDPKSSVCLLEIDHRALLCAQENLGNMGTRAQYIWSDIENWSPQKRRFDAVVMNPPFHQGRKSDISLGQRFIEKAAKHLKPHGELWMVANRHLPYEGTLEQYFRHITKNSEYRGFKIFQAKGLRKQG